MATEVRCSGTREAPHPVHALDVEAREAPESIRLVITAPQCSVDCFCCQRAGSADFAAPSLFRPGVSGGRLD